LDHRAFQNRAERSQQINAEPAEPAETGRAPWIDILRALRVPR
jgi:hypothetical protein